MKKLLVLVVLCCLMAVLGATAGVVTVPSSKPLPKVAALTVTDYVEAGKSALASHNIKGARDFFKLAVQFDPNSQEANFFYGVTRVFVVFEETYGNTAGLDSVREIFERTGFTFQTFGLYNIEGTEPLDGPLPTMPRTVEMIDFVKLRLLPELDNALVNFGKVNSSFTPTSIRPAALGTYGDDLQVDYADALAVKALVNLLKCNLNLLVVYGPDVHIPNVAEAPEQMMTYKQLFLADPNFLMPREVSRLAFAKTALVDFIDTFKLASDEFKLRPGTLNHLFVADVPWELTTNEVLEFETSELDEVNQTLALVKKSLYGSQEFPGDGPVGDRTLDLSKFFATDLTQAISIRSSLSDCAGNRAFPDPTFKGLFPLGLDMQDAINAMGPHMLGLTCADKGAPFIDVDQDYLYIQSDYPSGSATVEISNKGTQGLKISSITLAGLNASDFTLAPSASPTGCSSLTPTLAIGASCTVTVDLKKPPVTYGFLEAQLNISSDDPTNPLERIWVNGYVNPPPAGLVTGKMKDATTLQGIPGRVVFYHTGSYNWESGSAFADTSGNFSVDWLSSGTYKVQFIADDDYYAEQWFQGKLTQESADPVTLTPAAMTLPDVAMVKGGVVSGSVKDAGTKQGLSWITVALYDPQTNQFVASGQTDSTGAFRIPRLPAGTYSLQVSGDQWLPASSTVTVSANNTTQAGEILLDKGATITGTIRDVVSQSPISGVGVTLYDSQSGLIARSTSADFDGVYTFGGLPTGSYKIFFSGNRQGYQRVWHNNAFTKAEATPVTVTVPNSVTVNAALAKVTSTTTTLTAQSNGGTVTLTATVSSGGGIPAGIVTFRKENVTLGTAPLDAAGKATYTAELPPGTHNLYAYYSGNSSYNISSDQITQVVLQQQPQEFSLSVATDGEGSGGVNSEPGGIACVTGSSAGCSNTFTGQVTLRQTASLGSVFSGWSGACSGTGSCIVAMTGPMSVTATFTPIDPFVRIDGVSTRYYTMGGTFDAVSADGKTLRARERTFTEQLILNRPYAATLKGGYTDAAFSKRTESSFTFLSGALKIRQGALRVERLKLR